VKPEPKTAMDKLLVAAAKAGVRVTTIPPQPGTGIAVFFRKRRGS
jgi:hypothetical protein